MIVGSSLRVSMVKESQGLRCNLSLDDDSDECTLPLLWRREIFGKNGRKRSKTLRLFFLSTCVRTTIMRATITACNDIRIGDDGLEVMDVMP